MGTSSPSAGRRERGGRSHRARPRKRLRSAPNGRPRCVWTETTTEAQITADHGHVPSDPTRTVRLDREPGLLDDLRAPPTGERRMAYLHARPGRAAAARSYCAERLASAAECLRPAEALDGGLFGPGPASEAARRRAGDLLLLARDDYQFVYPFSPRREPTAFAGNHGALDRREMLVPLLALRL